MGPLFHRAYAQDGKWDDPIRPATIGAMPAVPMDNFRSPAALSRFFLTTIIALVADLATKVWAFKALVNHVYRWPDGTVHIDSRTYQFLPGWLDFTCVANQGAVFGLG